MNTQLSKKEEKFWYAIYTRPRSEKRVHELLLKNEYDSFLPIITTIRQWSDRKKKVQVPLISSYVFVRIAPNDLTTLLQFQGVVLIVKHLGKPAKIQDYEIENLRILLSDSTHISLTENIKVDTGDIVIVERGVFKGLIAECIKHNGKHRIIVRIQGVENVIEVNIPLSHIKNHTHF